MKGLPYTSHNFFEMVVPVYIPFTRLQQGPVTPFNEENYVQVSQPIKRKEHSRVVRQQVLRLAALSE